MAATYIKSLKSNHIKPIRLMTIFNPKQKTLFDQKEKAMKPFGSYM